MFGLNHLRLRGVLEMGRDLNQRETSVILNSMKRLSSMCDSPTLYIGHTRAIERALLMLEDALNGHHGNLSEMMQGRSHEALGNFDLMRDSIKKTQEHIEEIHASIKKGEYQ